MRVIEELFIVKNKNLCFTANHVAIHALPCARLRRKDNEEMQITRKKLQRSSG